MFQQFKRDDLNVKDKRAKTRNCRHYWMGHPSAPAAILWPGTIWQSPLCINGTHACRAAQVLPMCMYNFLVLSLLSSHDQEVTHVHLCACTISYSCHCCHHMIKGWLMYTSVHVQFLILVTAVITWSRGDSCTPLCLYNFLFLSLLSSHDQGVTHVHICASTISYSCHCCHHMIKGWLMYTSVHV